MVDPMWVALCLSPYIGGITLRNLLHHFDNNLEAILSADKNALKQVPGVGEKIASDIINLNLDAIQSKIQYWQDNGVQFVLSRDALYPPNLLKIPDEPPTLFVCGKWGGSLWEKSIAIVGTRLPSQDGFGAAMMIATYYAEQGFTIVSGLATGIDTSAHRGALSTLAGHTVAVLGSGVLNVYPRQNRQLAQAIQTRGAIISEVHPQASASNAGLVARNRIISGLCEVIFVVETTITGGAMYAARRAFEQGRLVYVLDLETSGNQALIQEGGISFNLDNLPDLSRMFPPF